MSYGLQVWDSAGVLSLDTTHRISRLVTTFSYSVSSPTSYNVAIAGMVNDGTWAAECIPQSGTLFSSGCSVLSTTIHTGYVTVQSNTSGYVKAGIILIWRY